MGAPTNKVSVRVGPLASDKKSAIGDDATFIAAASANDVSAARSDIASASLDSLEFIVNGEDVKEHYKPMELANWVPLLRPDAKVTIQVVSGDSDLQLIRTSLLLAGLASASESEVDGTLIVTATRKVAAKVSAAPLKKNPQSVVSLSLDDDGDDELIDEDALLNDGLVAPPPALGERTAGDDCSGRKPCDDCTCGRAEEWKDGKYVGSSGKTDAAPPTSSCGKCSLGDAFRCANCPYLGKPAFKAGEEHLVLDLTDDI